MSINVSYSRKSLVFAIAVIFVSISCSPSYQVAQQAAHNQQVREVSKDDAWQKIDDLVKPYRDELASEMGEVIGEIEQELWKGRPESPLGNFLSDAMLQYTEGQSGLDIAFACLNYGGVRISEIPAGPLKVHHIYEVMPFDNVLVVLPLEGALLQQLLDHIAVAGGWPISSGLRFRIDQDRAVDVRINGEPLDSKRNYLVAMPDFIANGGDRCDFLINIDPIEMKEVFLRDALISWARETQSRGEHISARMEQRIIQSDAHGK